MATSGSTNFSLTAREVVDFALKKLRVLGSDETATGEDAETAQRELNVMLKGWQKYPSLWRLTDGSQAMSNATASYSIAAPFRILQVSYRDTSGNDEPLRLMTRGEYASLTSRTTAGTPNRYYVDYQRDSTVLYVYPVKATITTETLRTLFQRRFEDIDSLDNDFDMRTEWLEVVGYNLASRLADDFGRAGPIVDRIIERAGTLLGEAIGSDKHDLAEAGLTV